MLLAVAAAVVLGSVVGRQDPLPSPLPASSGVGADLSVVSGAVSVSQSGVLVVPVLLRDRGLGLRVVSAQPYAEPVREDPTASPPQAVLPGQSRRFVVLLAPDCRFLTPRSQLSFRASLLVRVAQAGATHQLAVELDRDPAVASAVAGLCRR